MARTRETANKQVKCVSNNAFNDTFGNIDRT